MICLVRSIATDMPAGDSQDCADNPDGTAVVRNGKKLRMSLAPVGGGAVKLDEDENVEYGLTVGEGVETSLAARQVGLRPVWALLSTVGVKAFPCSPRSTV